MNIRKNVDGLRFSTWLLLIGALIIFVVSSNMWRKNIYLSDDRVVWGAVERALSTDGVEILIDGSDATTTQKETSKLDFDGDLSAETRSELKNEEIDSVVTVLSTKDKDYLLYERNMSTKYPDLKSLEGQWVDVSQADQTESKQLADTFTNGALVLTGNLPTKDKKQLIADMKKDMLYEVIGVVNVERMEGKEVRTYRVKLNPTAYNKALASYLAAIGLTQAASEVQLDNIDEGTPMIELAIEPGTRRLVAAGYPELKSSGARTYSNWGQQYSFTPPTSSMTVDELQNKVDSIYSQTTE